MGSTSVGAVVGGLLADQRRPLLRVLRQPRVDLGVPAAERPVWMRLIDFVIADWWCVCDACRPDVENARVDELKPARGLRRLLPHERDQLRRDGLTSTRSTAHR
jgi:hypothetical protein